MNDRDRVVLYVLAGVLVAMLIQNAIFFGKVAANLDSIYSTLLNIKYGTK